MKFCRENFRNRNLVLKKTCREVFSPREHLTREILPRCISAARTQRNRDVLSTVIPKVYFFFCEFLRRKYSTLQQKLPRQGFPEASALRDEKSGPPPLSSYATDDRNIGTVTIVRQTPTRRGSKPMRSTFPNVPSPYRSRISHRKYIQADIRRTSSRKSE